MEPIWELVIPLTSCFNFLLLGFLVLGVWMLFSGNLNQEQEKVKADTKTSSQHKLKKGHKLTDPQWEDKLKMGFIEAHLIHFSGFPMIWIQEHALWSMEKSLQHILKHLERARSSLMGQCLPEAKEVISSSITSAFVTQTPVLPGCDCKRENHSTGLNISSGSVGNISSLSSLPVFSEGATWQFQSQSLPDFHQKQPVFKSQHTPLSSFWFPEPEKSKFFQNLAAPSPLRPPSSFIDSIIESSNICTEEKTKDERTTKSHLTSDCGPNSVKEKPQLKGWTLIRLSPLARWELEGHIAWKVCTLREQTVPLAVRDSWAMLNYLIEVQRVPESENPHSQSSMPIHQKTEQNINNKSPDFPGLSSPETKTSQPLIQSKQPQPGDGPQILGSRPLVTSRDNLPPRNMGVKKIEEETTLLQKQPKYMLDFGRVEPRVVDLPEKSVFQQQKTQETDVAFTAKLPYQVTERTKVTPLALLQVMDSMGMIPESHTEVMKSMNLFPRPPNQVVKPMEAKEKANAIPEPPNQVIESRAVTPKLQHQGMASEGWTSRSFNQVTGNVKVTPVAFLQVMDPIGMTNQPHPHITGSGRFTTGSQCHVEESVKVDHQVIKSETVCPMPEHAVLGTVAMTGQPQHKVIESVGIASSPQSDVTESSKITPGSIPQNTKSLEIPPRPLYQVLDDRKVTPVTLLQAMDIMGLTRPAQPQISSLTPRPTKPDSLTSSCSLPTIIAPCKVVEPVDRPPRPPTKIMESVEVIPKPPHQAIGSPIAVGSPMGLMTGPQSPTVEAKGLTPSLISQVTNSLESTPKSWIKELESVGTTPQSHHQDLDFVALSSGPPQQVMGPLRFTPQQHPIPEYSKIGLKQNHQSTEMLGLTSDKWLQMRGSDKPPQSHHRIVESLGTIPRSLSQGKESMGMSQKPLQQVTESAVMTTASFLQDVNSMRVKPIPQFKAKECTKLFPGLQRVKPENLTLGPRFQSVKSLDLATGSVSQMIKYGRLTSAVESTGLAPELQQQSVKSEAVFPAQQLQSGLSGQSVPRPQLQDEQSVQLPLAPQLQCVKSTKLAPASQSQNKKSVDLGPKSQSQGMECIHLTMPPETVELTLRPVTQNIQSVELAPKPHLQDIRSETIAPKLMPKDVKTMELTPQMVECRSSASEVCPQEKEPVKLIPKQVMQSAGTAPVPHPQIFSEMISGPDCADTETGLTSEAFPQMAFTEKPTGQLGDSVKMTPQPPLQVTEAPEINLKPRYEDPEIVGLTFLEVGKTQRMAPGSLDLEKGSSELTPGSRMQDEKSEPLRQALKYVELTPEPSPLVVGSENLAIGPKPHTMELSPESLLQGVKSRQLDPELQSQDVKCGNLTKQLTTSKEEAELTPGKVSEKRTKRTQSESVKSGDLILDQGQQRVKSSGLTQGPQPQNFRFSVLTPGPLLQGEKCVDFVSGPPHHAMKFAELIPGSPMQEINWSDFTPGPPNQPLKAIHLTPELQDTKFEVLLPEPCLKNVKFSDLTPEPKDKSFKYGQLMPGSQLQDVKPPVLGPESSLQLSHEPQVADRKSVPSTPGSLFHSMKSVKLTKEQQFQGMKSEELNLGKQQQDVTFPELTPGPKLQSVKCGVEIPGPGLHSANSVEVMSELGLQDPIFTQTSAGFQGIKQIGLSPGPCLQNVRVFDLSPGTQPQGTKSSELSSGPQLHCVKISQLPTEAKTQGAPSVDLLPAPERQGDKPEMLVLEGLKYVELNQLPIVNKLVSEPHSKLARRSQFQGIKTSKLTQEPQVKDAEPLEWTLGSKFQGLNSEESTLEPQIRGDKYVEIISGPQVKDAKSVKFTSGSKLQGVKSVELIPGSKTQKCKTIELLLDSQLQEVKSVDLNLTSKTQGKNSMAFPPESLIQAIAKSMEVLQKPLFKGVRPEELILEPKMQDTKFVETSPSLKLQSSQSVEVNQDPKLQCVKSAKGTPRLKMEVVKSVNETVRQEFQGVKALDLSSRQRFQGTTGVDLTAEPEQDGKTSVMVTPDQQCAHLEHLKRESGSEGMASVELIPEPKFKDVKLVDLNAELKLKNMRSFELPPEPNIQGIKAKAQSQNIKSPQLTTGPPQLPQMKSLETTSRPQLQDQKTEVSNQKPELRNMKCVLPVPECQDEGSVDFIPGVQSLGVEMAELKQLRDGSLKSAQWIPGSEVQGRKSEVLSIGSQFQDVKPATLKPMVKLRDVLSSEMILGGTKLSDEKFMESHLESGWQLKKIPELFPGLQLQKGKKMEPHSKSQLQSVKVVQLNQEPELGSMKSAQWIPGPEFQCRKSVGLSIGSQSHGVKPGQLKPALQLRAVKSSELTLGSKLQDEESMEFNSEPQQPIRKTLNLSPELQMQNGTHVGSPSEPQLQSVNTVPINEEPKLECKKYTQWIPGPLFQGRESVVLNKLQDVKPMKFNPGPQLQDKKSDRTLEHRLQDLQSAKLKPVSPVQSAASSELPLKTTVDFTPKQSWQDMKSSGLTKDANVQDSKSFGVNSVPQLQDGKLSTLMLGTQCQGVRSVRFNHGAKLQNIKPPEVKKFETVKSTEVNHGSEFQVVKPSELALGSKQHSVLSSEFSTGRQCQDEKPFRFNSGPEQGVKAPKMCMKTKLPEERSLDFKPEPKLLGGKSFEWKPEPQLQYVNFMTFNAEPRLPGMKFGPELQGIEANVSCLGPHLQCVNSSEFIPGPTLQCENPFGCNSKSPSQGVKSSELTAVSTLPNMNFSLLNPGTENPSKSSMLFNPGPHLQSLKSESTQTSQFLGQAPMKCNPGPQMQGVRLSELSQQLESQGTKSSLINQEPHLQGVESSELIPETKCPEIYYLENHLGPQPLQEPELMDLTPVIGVQGSKSLELTPDTSCQVPDTMDLHSQPWPQFKSFGVLYTKPLQEVAESEGITSEPKYRTAETMGLTYEARLQRKEPLRIAPNPISQDIEHTKGSRRPSFQALEPVEMIPKKRLKREESVILIPKSLHHVQESPGVTLGPGHQVIESVELPSETWTQVRDHRDLTSKSWNHMGSSGSVSENQVAESARTQLQVSKSIGVTPVAYPKVVDSVEVTPGPLFEVVKSEAFTSRPTLQMVDSVELPSKPQYMSRSAFTSGLWLQNVNSKGLITTQEPTHQLLETSEFTGFQIVKTVLLPGSLIQIVKSELAPGLIPQLVEPKIVQRTQLEEIGNLDLPARPHLQERVEPVELTPRPNIQVKPGELISLPTFTLEKPIVLTPEPEVQAVKSTGIKTESPQVMESEDLHLGQVYQNRKSKELMSAELQVGNYLSKFIHSSSSARISRPIKTMSEKGSSWGSKMPQGSKDLDSWKNSELEAFQPGEPDEAPITTQSSVRPVNLPNPSSSQTAITVETPHPEVPRVDVISQEKTKRKQIEGTDNSLQSPSQHPSRSRRLSSEIPQAVSGVRRGLTRPILGRQQNVWESRACKQRLPRKYLSNMAKLGNILGATVEKKGCLQTFLAEEATADPCKSIQKLFGIPAELMNPPQGLLEKDHSIVFHSSVVKNYVQRHTSCHGPEKRKTLRIWTRGFPSSIIQQYLGTRVGLEKTNSRFSDTSQEVKQHMPFSYTKDQIPAPVKSDSSHRIFCTQMNYFPIEESENSQSDSQTRTLEDQYTFGSSYLPQAKSDFSEQSRQLQDLQLKIAAKLLRSQLPPNVPPPFATGLVLKYPICLQCGRCSGFACCHKSQNPCGPYLIIYPQLHLVNTPEGHGGIRLHLGFRLRTGKRPQVPKYHGRDKPVTTKSPLSPSQRKAKINTQAIKSPTPTTDVWSGLSQTPTPVQAPIRQDQYGRPDPAGKTEIGECGHYELIQVHSLPESSTESIQEEKWAELHLQKTHNTKYLMRKLTKEVRPQSSGSLIESPSRELPVRLRRKRLGAAQATTASLKRKPKPSSHPSFMHLLFQSFKQAFQIAHRVVVSTGQKLENRERSDKLGLGKNSCLKQKARDQGLFRESQREGKPDIKIRPTDPTTKLGRTNQFRSDQQPKRETLFQSRSTQLSKSTVSSKGACQTTSIPESQIHSSSGDKQSYKRASSSQQPKNLAKPGTRVEARGQTRQGSSRKTSTSSRFQEKPPHKEQDRQSGPSQRSPHSLSERSRHSSAKGTGLGVPKNRHHRASERSPRSPSERRRHILSEGGHRSPSERRHILSEESHRSPSERRHILFEGSHQSPSERGHRSPSERRRRILSDRGHRSPSEKSPGSHSKRTPQKPSERSHRSHSEKPQRSPSEKTPSDPAAREPGTVPLREAQTALRRESSTMPPGRGQGAECPKMS